MGRNVRDWRFAGAAIALALVLGAGYAFFSVAGAAAGPDAHPGRDVAISPASEPVDAVHFFRDPELAGFRVWLPGATAEAAARVFTVVEEGTLRISGEGFGYLRTERAYRNYRLETEFRWGDGGHESRAARARDSGIFVHAQAPDGNSHDGDGAYMAGIECNLFEGATGDVLLIRGNDAAGALIKPHVEYESSAESDVDGFHWWRPGGERRVREVWGRVNWRHKARDWRDIRGFRGPEDVERPPGEWNRLVIECRSDSVEIRLNGVLVNRVTAARPSEGRILFQCEGSEVLFRRTRLMPLTAPDAAPPRG